MDVGFVGRALRRAHGSEPSAVPDIVFAASAALGAGDVVMYLVDFSQSVLQPVLSSSAPNVSVASIGVDGSMEGRCFLDQTPVTAERGGATRVWVPIAAASDVSGVLALTVRTVSDELITACTELGLLAGSLIAAHGRGTDVYDLYRRRQAMSLSASIQWDLLPPLVLKTPAVTVAGLVEPAYEVGGDCFDYAVNGSHCDVGLFDAVGHDLTSSMLASLTVGAYRHARRNGKSLEQMHLRIDAAIGSQYHDSSFTTGILARIDLVTGVMKWTNAGHPPPLLIRHGRVVGQLSCAPTKPWGLSRLNDSGWPLLPDVASEGLEPGDSILIYSDGAIEAQSALGVSLGIERLVDLVGRYASDGLDPEQIIRRLARSVVEHHDTTLTDDATFVLLRWHGPR